MEYSLQMANLNFFQHHRPEHIVPHEQAFADKLGDREPIEDVGVLLARRIQDRSQLLSVGFVRLHLATSSNIAAESAVQLKVVST